MWDSALTPPRPSPDQHRDPRAHKHESAHDPLQPIRETRLKHKEVLIFGTTTLLERVQSQDDGEPHEYEQGVALYLR